MSIPSFLMGGAVGMLAAAASFTPEGRAFTAKIVNTVKDDLEKATTTTAAPDAASTDAKDEHHAQTA